MVQQQQKKKKKIVQTKTPMPEQPPAERVHNFDEVPYGYTPEQAREEAARCLGATPLRGFLLVTLPLVRSGLVAGGIFAFIISFSNMVNPFSN